MEPSYPEKPYTMAPVGGGYPPAPDPQAPQAYPPQAGGYPPAGGAYPPQQAAPGYPPQQQQQYEPQYGAAPGGGIPGYPPPQQQQQPGYPPPPQQQQPGYPPQQQYQQQQQQQQQLPVAQMQMGGYPAAGGGGMQMGYPAGQYGSATVGTTVMMVQQPRLVGFGRGPTQCTCPNCRASVVTNVSISPGATAWCACVIIGLCFWPCMCLPFCLDDCQDITHSCPSCGLVIHRRQAMSD